MEARTVRYNGKSGGEQWDYQLTYAPNEYDKDRNAVWLLAVAARLASLGVVLDNVIEVDIKEGELKYWLSRDLAIEQVNDAENLFDEIIALTDPDIGDNDEGMDFVQDSLFVLDPEIFPYNRREN